MSENFPGNPWGDVHSQVRPDTAGLMSAMYLMAYEQRTANLISLYSGLVSAGWPAPSSLLEEIDRRLGLKDEKDEKDEEKS